jgi:hypothetical protein
LPRAAPPYGRRSLSRRLLRQAGRRQLRHVGNIAIAVMTATAHRQHGGDALQVNVALLNRQRTRRTHDGGKLAVGERNHCRTMPQRGRFSSQPANGAANEKPPGVNRAAANCDGIPVSYL